MKIRQIFILLISCALISCSPVQERVEGDAQLLESNVNFDCPLQFRSVPLCAQLIPLQNPTRVTVANSFKLRFWSRTDGTADGPFVDPGFDVYVRPWMRMASGDHGSPTEVVVNKILDDHGNPIPGVYRLDQVRFTMKGRWEIQIKLNKDGKLVDEVIQNIQI